MPVKLGSAKCVEYVYTLMHYFDLNQILSETNKLRQKHDNITNLIDTHPGYLNDSQNYIKLLNILQMRVETKIADVIPHPKRLKRGLVNVAGSVFKAITGNLDASDGEYYDKVINNLQHNQNELANSILKQNSISLSVISKFNQTLQQMNGNDKYLESKINQIGMIVQGSAYRENSLFIKDVLIQMINTYEIIESILQDLQNSITFAKLKIIHPSIIKINDLYKELLIMQEKVGNNQMVLPVSLENTFLYEKLIKIDCFILDNKINFLLRIPVSYPKLFDYFHLYSIPVIYKSWFKAVLTQNNYLIKNELQHAYYGEPCAKVTTNLHLCKQEKLQKSEDNNPCEIALLESNPQTTTCQKIQVLISRPIINQLENSNQWIFVMPKEETVKLKCNAQEEIRRLHGTYLVQIPSGCLIKTNNQTVINGNRLTNATVQPILFPDWPNIPVAPNQLDLSVHIEEIKLDDLTDLKTQIQSTSPQLQFPQLYHYPSIWTIFIYVVLITCCGVTIYKKCIEPRRLKKNPEEDERRIDPRVVQLPLQTA